MGIMMDDSYRKYLSIGDKIVSLLMRFCWFGMNCMQTRWVSVKFGIIRYYGMRDMDDDADAISLNSTNMRKAVNESTLKLIPNPKDMLYPEEREKRLEMKTTLINDKVFDAFMRHLLQEYCSECLLCIIEMQQFKDRLFKERLTENQRLMMAKSMRRLKTQHFLHIGNTCPKSQIVYGEGSDWKYMAINLYKKYIKRGSIYEVNLEWETRRELSDLIANNRWTTNAEYDDPLNMYCLFDGCLLELHSLLLPAFCRFCDSDGHRLIQAQYQTRSLLTPKR